MVGFVFHFKDTIFFVNFEVMKTISLNSYTIKIAQSAQQISRKRQHNFDLCILKEYGITSDMSSLVNKFQSLMNYQNGGMLEEAAQETENLMLSFIQIFNGLSHTSTALGWYILQVNGKEFNPKSNEEISDLMESLVKDGLKQGHVESLVNYLKKKYLHN